MLLWCFLLSIFHVFTKTLKLLLWKKFPILYWLQGFCSIAQNMAFLKMQTSPSLVPRPSHHLSFAVQTSPRLLSVCVICSTKFIQASQCLCHLQYKIHPGFSVSASFAVQTSSRLLSVCVICSTSFTQASQCLRHLQYKLHPGFSVSASFAVQNSSRLLHCKQQILQRPGKEATLHTHHTSSIIWCRLFPFFTAFHVLCIIVNWKTGDKERPGNEA